MSRTLVWERLGSRFLTNIDGPSMKWSIELSQYNVVAAECAGIIATWPRTENVARPIMHLSSNNRQQIQLFSSNGTAIRSITLDFGNILNVSILADETIIAISDNGVARHYVDYGLNFTQIQLPPGSKEIRPYANGYFVSLRQKITNEDVHGDRFFLVSNCNSTDPSFRELDNSIAAFNIVDWCVVPENKNSGRPLRHVFLDDEGRIHIYDFELSTQSHRVVFHNGPTAGKLKLSPNAESLALSDSNKKLIILSSELYEVEFDSQSVSEHTDIYWVGPTMIALSCDTAEGQINVIDIQSSLPVTENNATIYFEDKNVVMIEEIDGLRNISAHSHSILMPIAKATSDIFKLGSVSPSAILYGCVDLIDAGSPRAEQTIKMLEQSKLNNAVETCITAAILEIEPKMQKRLMKAALFGKSLLKAYDSTRFLQTIKYLRIGNSLRSLGDMGLFITNAEIEHLSIVTLIKRLQSRKFWGEAVSLALSMSVAVEPIYIEWACSNIQKEENATDQQIIDIITSKMNKLKTYSRSKMSLKALEQGRQELALSLLEEEPVISERVALLMEMGMTHQALQQAVGSGNPFIVDYVLSVLTEQLSLPQLVRIIGGSLIAVSRQQSLIKAKSFSINEDQSILENRLHEYFHQMDVLNESFKLELQAASTEADVQKKIRILRSLEKKFASSNKKILPKGKACSDWADLLTFQNQISETFELDLRNKSAAETIYSLLKIQQLAQAQKAKSKLGISDRQFLWLRMRSLIDRRDFEDLWELSQARKPTISFQSFFNICYEAGNKEQASRYVHLITEASIEDKVKMYIKCNSYDLARTLAGRNLELLKLIPS